MTSPVVALLADQPVPLASDVMAFRHIRHLPVIDSSRRLVGLVSHRDLLAARASMPRDQGTVCVEAIMTRDVRTVRPEVNASRAAATLVEHKVGCLPVTDEGGVLVGIVTEHDFVRFATKVLAASD